MNAHDGIMSQTPPPTESMSVTPPTAAAANDEPAKRNVACVNCRNSKVSESRAPAVRHWLKKDQQQLTKMAANRSDASRAWLLGCRASGAPSFRRRAL